MGKKAGEHLTVSGMVAAERFARFTQQRSDVFFFNVLVKSVDSNNKKKNSDQPHP